MVSATLVASIRSRRTKIGVIGVGYVGLPLAVLFARKGFSVTGFGRDDGKIKLLQSGNSPIESVAQKELQSLKRRGKLRFVHVQSQEFAKQDVYFVCVPTPVDEQKKPDIAAIREVAKRLSQVNLDGKLIINESTVAPGTTRAEFGNLGGSYFLACSPERIDPGNKDKTVARIAKIVGGVDKNSLELAKALYEIVLEAPVVSVSTLEAAEMVKMLENTYRAVNIALVNEFARLAEKNGLDILEIIEAAKTKWSFQAHYPSLGVGGHCIPVDPWYLVDWAKKKHIDMPLVVQGLRDNDQMAEHVAGKIASFYQKGKTVLIYGLTYKKNVKDLRESPVIRLTQILKKRNIQFTVYDPLLSPEEIRKLSFPQSRRQKVDIFVVGTDHDLLKSEYQRFVGPRTIVVDGRNFFPRKIGQAVYGIGRTLL